MINDNKVTIFHQLKELFDEMRKMDREDIDELAILLEQINISDIVEYYLKLDNDHAFDDMDLFTCKKLVEILQYIYNNTDMIPPVSDNTYDQLYELIIEKGIGDIVGALNPEGVILREHKYPDLRGTLDKVHFVYNVDKNGDKRKSIEDKIRYIEDMLGCSIYESPLFDVRLQRKRDGVSLVVECDEEGMPIHAMLRGDTDINQARDVIDLLRGNTMFKKYANGKKFGVKTEAVVQQDKYIKICEEVKEFATPRSAVSSIFNTGELDINMMKYVDIIPLRIQYDGGFVEILVDDELDMHGNLYNLRELEYKIHEMNKQSQEMGLETDGVVIILEHPEAQRKLGRHGAINRFEFAFKFPAEAKKTAIIDIDFSIGLGGNITPVAKIQPVIMLGKEIKSVTLGSVERYKSFGLMGKGDEVIIRYEIIPYLELDYTCKKATSERIEVPVYCKYCGVKLVEDPVLRCGNEECSSRIVGNIVNYINKMRIDDIGIGVVSSLFDHKILNSIEDLYRLKNKKSDIVEIPGFGEKSYYNMVESIEERMEVFDYELLASLGIQSIGERKFKKVLAVMSLDELLYTCINLELPTRLISLPGFGQKTINRIQDGINAKFKTIEFLLKTLKLKHSSNNLTNKGSICFSNIRDKDFQNELIAKGYEIKNSVTSDLSILIVPSLDSESSKITSAKEKGIKIMTLDEAIREL